MERPEEEAEWALPKEEEEKTEMAQGSLHDTWSDVHCESLILMVKRGNDASILEQYVSWASWIQKFSRKCSGLGF